jgi:predicted nucleic-acid-binding Zn-ribbon protein
VSEPAGSCRVCKNKLFGSHELDICDMCRNTLGILAMPPARRPPAPCAKCGGTKLVRAIPRDHSATPGENGNSVALPMRLTVVPVTASGLLTSRKHARQPDPSTARGLLEAYVCRACGFVEWYCADPEKIPIGPEFMTEEIDVGDAPYR